MVAGFPAPEAYFGFESRLRWPPRGPQRRNNAYDTRRGSPATELDCYVPGKDVVVPVDAIVGRSELPKLPRPGATFACRPPRKAKVPASTLVRTYVSEELGGARGVRRRV